MATEHERIERYTCNECSPGIPPCKLEISTENPEGPLPDTCIYSFKIEGQAHWIPEAYKLVEFDWRGGIKRDKTDWIRFDEEQHEM